MPEPIATLLVDLATLHVACGSAFVAVVLPRLVVRLDPGLREAPWTVRLLIAPGLVALWPLFAWRLATGRGPSVERNAHRVAASRRPTGARP